MSQFIPNEESWVGFLPAGAHEFGVADIDNPTVAEVEAAVDITDLVVSINATTTGSTVPVPRLKRRFEPSIAGTATGQLTGDFYQDNVRASDIAVANFQRGAKGAIIISRYGGTGTDLRPALGDHCEVWPIEVSTMGKSNMASNTAQTATLTAAVPQEPNEDTVVAA